MEWVPKTPLHLDWETLALFGEKDCEISKPSEESDCKFEGDIGVNNVSACSSCGAGTCSGSELGNGSPKSSISAFMDCSEIGASNVNMTNGLSKVADISVGISAGDRREPFDVVELGKRTSCEDSPAGNSVKSSSTVSSVPTTTSSAKKPKAYQQNLQIYCQVEGCKTDLSKSKEYHRKHKVCMIHSKSPKVIVSGRERRFCQQCSRFHSLSEFDQKKRSCRRRLSDHNARRRKPPLETISFSSPLFSAPHYDDNYQMNLVFGQARFGHINTATSATWDFSGGFKQSQVKESRSESINAEYFLPTSVPTNTSTVLHAFDGPLSYKGTTAEVLGQGLESPLGASNFEGVQDTQRALSLLSIEPFGLSSFGPNSTVHHVDANISSSTLPEMHASDILCGFGLDQQQHQVKELSFDLHGDSFQLQNFQLQKPEHEDFFFDSS